MSERASGNGSDGRAMGKLLAGATGALADDGCAGLPPVSQATIVIQTRGSAAASDFTLFMAFPVDNVCEARDTRCKAWPAQIPVID